MLICGYLGGYEGLLIILRLAIFITLIIIGVKLIRKWDNSLKQIKENQDLIIKRLDELNNK